MSFFQGIMFVVTNLPFLPSAQHCAWPNIFSKNVNESPRYFKGSYVFIFEKSLQITLTI